MAGTGLPPAKGKHGEGTGLTEEPGTLKGGKVKVKESEVAQSCPTLCDPMDCSLPGSSIHGISQARVLEWVAIAFLQVLGILKSVWVCV